MKKLWSLQLLELVYALEATHVRHRIGPVKGDTKPNTTLGNIGLDRTYYCLFQLCR